MRNIFKRIKTLWILSSWNIQSSKKEGSFTIDGIVRSQVAEKPHQAQIIKRRDPVADALKE